MADAVFCVLDFVSFDFAFLAFALAAVLL